MDVGEPQEPEGLRFSDVFTGDPNATPGGSVDPVRNPEGLTSRWCGATVVAKFWFALN
jgi:hypothetical protein